MFRIKSSYEDPIKEPIGGGGAPPAPSGGRWGHGSTLNKRTISGAQLRELLGNLKTVGWGRSTAVRVPVGTGNLSILQPGGGVYTVVSGQGTVGSTPLPPAIDRRDNSQDSTNVQGGVTRVFKSWSDYVKAGNTLPTDYNKYPTPSTYPGTPTFVPSAPPSLPPTQTGSGAMDLGNLLNTGLDLWGKYEQIKSLQNPVVTTTTPALDLPNWGDALELFTDPVTGETGVIAAKKCKRRRRRRRLATTSDIKDLAALKAVLGNGEAFKTWIATHSR